MQNSKKIFWLFLTVVIVVELALFRNYYQTNIAPYHPRHHDQLHTIIQVYEAYQQTREDGVQTMFDSPSQLFRVTFKSTLVPVLGYINLFLLGYERFSLAMVNFFFFALGQIVLCKVFLSWRGIPAALTVLGLFLLSNTHYYWAGGLDDFRFDYAGMITFGLSFLAILYCLERPGWLRISLCLAIFLLLLATRSITLVYVIGSLLGVTPFYGIIAFYWRKLPVRYNPRFRSAFILLIGSIPLFVGFLALHWQEVSGYYLGSGESDWRWSLVGASTLDQCIGFYLDSSVEHFYTVYLVSASLLALVGLGLVWSLISRPKGSLAHFKRTPKTLILFAMTFLAVIGACSMYHPSSITIGVLTIPFAIAAAVPIAEGLGTYNRRWIFPLVGALVATGGFFEYADAMLSPTYPPRKDEEQSINRVMANLEDAIRLAGEESSIGWMFSHDGVNWAFLDVSRLERSKLPKINNFRGNSLVDTYEYIESHLKADIVVAYTKFPIEPLNSFPFDRKVQELDSRLRKRLKEEFHLMSEVHFPKDEYSIGVYVRGKIARAETLSNKLLR